MGNVAMSVKQVGRGSKLPFFAFATWSPK